MAKNAILFLVGVFFFYLDMLMVGRYKFMYFRLPIDPASSWVCLKKQTGVPDRKVCVKDLLV